MLYDPKWDVQVKADPAALTSLIAWLETMPSSKSYDWMDTCNCLAGQYMRACGISRMDPDRPLLSELLGGMDRYAAVAGTEPFTFGAALARARALSSPQGTK